MTICYLKEGTPLLGNSDGDKDTNLEIPKLSEAITAEITLEQKSSIEKVLNSLIKIKSVT